MTILPAVTSVELAAHALGEAVGLVLAEERADLQDWNCFLHQPFIFFLEQAGHSVQICDLGVVPVQGDFVDLGQPLQVAVARQGVTGQQELRDV